ncbi:hypothetical protein QQ054_15220 [Oscillatoria amoena NRMC-F 0135]|nr:hypothetical protein [Oscillatoria amoena NRMC-F 0135]
MKLTSACCNILKQLQGLVEQIEPTDFAKPVPTLGNSTIGQHLRHTLEFFICLEGGYKDGLVNYDKRGHDKLIESDKFIAMAALTRIRQFVETHNSDIQLSLEVGYDLKQDDYTTVQTNFKRELVYNIEHAVHHMAIMKIGIREIAPYVTLPADFGIAASTIRYQEKAALTPS